MSSLDELDRKLNETFPGRVVRKDLVRQVKVGANVPTYVLEYLLGKYCATDDPVAIEAGLRLVNNTLAESVIRPDEAMKAQSRVKERGSDDLHRQSFWCAWMAPSTGPIWSTSATPFVHIPDSYCAPV